MGLPLRRGWASLRHQDPDTTTANRAMSAVGDPASVGEGTYPGQAMLWHLGPCATKGKWPIILIGVALATVVVLVLVG